MEPGGEYIPGSMRASVHNCMFDAFFQGRRALGVARRGPRPLSRERSNTPVAVAGLDAYSRAVPGLHLRLMIRPPPASINELNRNTNVTPKAEPMAPNMSGVTMWVKLLSVARRPNASPERPPGARS